MRSAVAQKLPIHPDVIEALDKEIEIESCTNKYDYLVTAFEECESTSFTAADVKRLESRLIHVYTRVKLLGSEGTTLIKKVNDLYARLQDVAKMSISDSLEAYDTEDAVAAVRPANRDPKIYKWGLTYSGDVPNVSLGDFLDEVEDRRASRQISKNKLFECAADLFTGTARIWFRANREKLTSWDDLVSSPVNVFNIQITTIN
ncbi:hypothetical protein GE061_020334 [Apolygus lucorum]|uniref:Uncharacterized protein n=1 Tax=Apolygus lucorum TaxID=248454 RepID=A0A8S9WIP7_APOLU|nr:hypothetical protein GE061_020334 [Apolygus lucorum]